MNRRELLRYAAGLMGARLAGPVVLAVTACSNESDTQTNAKSAAPARASIFNQSERAMIETLVELIIPTTDTPGAAEAGVGAFIDVMVSNWYSDDDGLRFRGGLALLNEYCFLSFNRDFLSCDEEQQVTALAAAEKNRLDTVSDGKNDGKAQPPRVIERGPWDDLPKGGAAFFSELKQMTILGYYTSEIGSTQELIYDPVPGSYDGDVDFYERGRHYTR